MKRSRLEHFLEAYGPLDAKIEKLIYDRVHRANAGTEDPLSMQIAHDTILEFRMRTLLRDIKRTPVELSEAMAACIKSMQAAQARVDAQYARKIADHIAEETKRSLESSLPRLEQQLMAGARSRNWRARILMVAACLTLFGLSGASGFIMGRVAIGDKASEYAALATEPDAATWHRLQRANDSLDLLIVRNCGPGRVGHLEGVNGRKACLVPLWLEEAAIPRPISHFARGRKVIASWWSGLGPSLRFLLGFVAFIFVSVIGLEVRTQVRSKKHG